MGRNDDLNKHNVTFEQYSRDAENLYQYILQICNDEDVKNAEFIKEEGQAIRKVDMALEMLISEGLNTRVVFAVLLDVTNIYMKLGHGNLLYGEEGVVMATLIFRLIGGNNSVCSSEEIMRTKGIEIASGFISAIGEYLKKIREKIKDRLLLVDFLRSSEIREDVINKYIMLLYVFADRIAEADGEITDRERETLNRVIGLVKEDRKDLRELGEENGEEYRPEEQLAGLIGLEMVKDEVKKMKDFITIQRMRKESGLKTAPISYHFVFTGNPGTGKTTVARILASIYKELGILKRGQLVETDRSGLVAEYVGQTAVKTNKVIDSAIDGVLFIDEAYSLSKGSGSDFGEEAISTLLKRMEDDRERLIVILAGYSDRMTDFIESNPGLKSRFRKYINFEDYNECELKEIFLSLLAKNDYCISREAICKLETVIGREVMKKDRSFGNARFVRNLFEKTIENQASRLATEDNVTSEKLEIILSCDVEEGGVYGRGVDTNDFIREYADVVSLKV